jgi:hypothetical protein
LQKYAADREAQMRYLRQSYSLRETFLRIAEMFTRPVKTWKNKLLRLALSETEEKLR